MGQHGPPPKRSEQRRRTNAPPQEVTKSEGIAVEPPEGDPDWHPLALEWFESLKVSGQSAFYQASDWTAAKLLAEAISRELKPQPMLVQQGKDQVIEMVEQAPKAASVAAWLKGMTALMATEGDRRRAAMELQRPKPPGEGGGHVAWIDDARRRLQGSA